MFADVIIGVMIVAAILVIVKFYTNDKNWVKGN